MIIESAEQLDAYCQYLNEKELDNQVPIIDNEGFPWLTFGEQHSGGGEYMRVWFANTDYENNSDKPSCDFCDRSPMNLSLTEANYPIRILWSPDVPPYYWDDPKET